jgi:hypothetical protein
MKVELTEDLDRISKLLYTDSIGESMSQYDDRIFDVQELGHSYYIIASHEDEDLGIFILDKLSYNNHFNIHTGFIKSARGFKAFAAGKLFVSYIKELLPHGCIMGMPPVTKPSALVFGSKIGFKLMVIIPSAIEIGTKQDNNVKHVDMAIMALTW